jgi:hypothetical protein
MLNILDTRHIPTNLWNILNTSNNEKRSLPKHIRNISSIYNLGKQGTQMNETYKYIYKQLYEIILQAHTHTKLILHTYLSVSSSPTNH